jgi:hypothetical protein
MSKRRPRIPGTRNPRRLCVLPSIPDQLDPKLKNALAIRNACAIEGKCHACGTVGELEPDPTELMFHLTFRHEDWCPVLSDGEAA